MVGNESSKLINDELNFQYEYITRKLENIKIAHIRLIPLTWGVIVILIGLLYYIFSADVEFPEGRYGFDISFFLFLGSLGGLMSFLIIFLITYSIISVFLLRPVSLEYLPDTDILDLAKSTNEITNEMYDHKTKVLNTMKDVLFMKELLFKNSLYIMYSVIIMSFALFSLTLIFFFITVQIALNSYYIDISLDFATMVYIFIVAITSICFWINVPAFRYLSIQLSHDFNIDPKPKPSKYKWEKKLQEKGKQLLGYLGRQEDIPVMIKKRNK